MNQGKPSLHTYFILFGLMMAVGSLPFSIKVCHFALLIVIMSWILEGQWMEKWNSFISNPVAIVLALFFLLHVFGLLYTEDVTNGWFSIEKKAAFIILPVVLVSTQRFKRIHIDLIFLTFIGACFVGTVICLIHAVNNLYFVGQDPLASSLFWTLNSKASKTWILFSYTGLASGIDIHPTYFSLYLIFCLLLLYKFLQRDFLTRQVGVKVLIIVFGLFLSLFIIFLSSRITTLAFLLFLLIGMYILVRRQNKVKRFIFSFLTVSFFLYLIYLNPISRYRNYQEPISDDIGYSLHQSETHVLSTSIRASLWWLGLKSLEDINLSWGAGPGDVKSVMEKSGKKYSVSNIIGSYDPHNQFLQTTIGLGFIGAISLLSCFVLPAILAYRNNDFFYMAFIGLFVFVGLTETVLEMQKGIVFFSLFNSLLIFQCADWSVSHKRKINYA